MVELGIRRGQGRKAQRSDNDESWDRFSNLPEPIIHHIFSFLEMDDIVRIGMVSKKGRQMYVTSPYLKFKTSCSYDGPPNLCKQFSERVNNFLRKRNGLEIRCLSVHWHCHNPNCDTEADLTDKWIDIAVSCQVQEIDLELGIPEGPFDEEKEDDIIIELPRCMFGSNTLRVLKLDLQNKRLKVPTGAFNALEELSLYSLLGSDAEKALKRLLSTACPSLKRLTLVGLEEIKSLKINHPCIEELTLLDPPYDLLDIDISTDSLQKLSLELNLLDPGYACRMTIHAPNLQDLKWTARTANNVHLSQFTHLQNATLCVGIYNDYVEEATIRNRITKLLQSVCCSRELHIQSDVLETLFLHNRLPIVFDNLQHLSITVNSCLEDYHFPVLASVLKRSPNLETLCLTCSETGYQPDDAGKLKSKVSKFLNQHEGFHDLLCPQLKAVEIELKGNWHQVVVIENMLKIATGLKKMTVIYSEVNSIALSKIGLHNSTTASLPFEVKLVEKEFPIEDSQGIDLHRATKTARKTMVSQ